MTSTYVFKVKTPDGNRVGNITITGTSQADAERKLFQRYKNSTVLDVQVR